MLKNYNYILTIVLYPFILILSYLMLTNYIKGRIYLYLIIIMIVLFIPSFIMTLYGISHDILTGKSKWKIILLILFSWFYIPFYYTNHAVKQEKYLGYIIPVLGLFFSYLTFTSLNNSVLSFLNDAYKSMVVINDNYIYESTNKLFTIGVSKDFRCFSNDVGDYVIFCDRLDDDSFIGIYSYDVTDFSEQELTDILSFHINQTLEYIEEKGYESELVEEEDIIKIYYQNMIIMITQRNYINNDTNYSLIISKEMPKESANKEEFEKMIETIEFLNYNEEVSS